MRRLAMKGIEIVDADRDFIQYTCRNKTYDMDIDMDDWLYCVCQSNMTDDDQHWAIQDLIDQKGYNEWALDYIEVHYETIDELTKASIEIL